MDLETENRIAALLLKEAAELRQQAEKEGVHAYLRKPEVRGRPNSRFLTATVLGVQQANKAVEVNEMWRVRKKELELDQRLKEKSKEESSRKRRGVKSRDALCTFRETHAAKDDYATSSFSSDKRVRASSFDREDDGLRDEEIDEFLHSRIKRGRGAVGSRMDETGPYLPRSPDTRKEQSTSQYLVGPRTVVGPEKNVALRPSGSSTSISSLSSNEEHNHFYKKTGKELLEKRKSKKKSDVDRRRKAERKKKRKSRRTA